MFFLTTKLKGGNLREQRTPSRLTYQNGLHSTQQMQLCPAFFSHNAWCIIQLELNRLDSRLIGLLAAWRVFLPKLEITSHPVQTRVNVVYKPGIRWNGGGRSWGTRWTISAMRGAFGLVSGSRYF